MTKGAVYLDILAGIKCAAFDKTGTLTEGKFTVVKVNGDERALALAPRRKMFFPPACTGVQGR